ncbi:hypothetical protein ID866_10172 [Astraeus odoratus]|nr:hypothetical protein ID866_10172 [Astraeus odoratus]
MLLMPYTILTSFSVEPRLRQRTGGTLLFCERTVGSWARKTDY